MANYNPSTRARIADMITGMHVKTTDAILTAAHFTSAAQTELFNVVGRIAIVQMFVELTAAADANAAQVLFNCTFSSPSVVTANTMGAKCGSIASLPAGAAITYVAGAVASTTSITDGAYFTDVEAAGRVGIVGGETSAGANTVGTIGILVSDDTQAATITATGHLFYYPMSKGAYAKAAL
jgi:hypothetical protein